MCLGARRINWLQTEADPQIFCLIDNGDGGNICILECPLVIVVIWVMMLVFRSPSEPVPIPEVLPKCGMGIAICSIASPPWHSIAGDREAS